MITSEDIPGPYLRRLLGQPHAEVFSRVDALRKVAVIHLDRRRTS